MENRDVRWYKHPLSGTILLLFVFGLFAYLARVYDWPFVFIGCWGGIGAIAQELLQSGGNKFLPDPKPKDWTYLGSFAGAITGAVTCLVSSKTWLTFEEAGVKVTSGNYYETGLAVFIAALAAKGGLEALLGKEVKTTETAGSRTPPDAGRPVGAKTDHGASPNDEHVAEKDLAIEPQRGADGRTAPPPRRVEASREAVPEPANN